jgi:hypothetical protein
LGGTIYDGSGRPGERGDIAISDGRITAIGKISGRAQREIDASGLASRLALSASRRILISRCRLIRRRRARFARV